jgi:thioredoxin-dependent peroxiredoxin
MLKVGDKAPKFVVPGTSGQVDLAATLNQGPVVLYFFPRAMTGGCTMEAQEFDHLLPEFNKLGVSVVGMSVDPVPRQQRFRENYGLQLHFASDHDRAVGMAYGTLKGDATTSNERDTVVVGKNGIIRLAYQRVTAKGHAAKVLADVQKLRGEGVL